MSLGRTALLLAMGMGLAGPRGAAAQVRDADSARAQAFHLLNRITFGPRPGDVGRVLAMGIDQYIDLQLHPERIDDSALERELKGFDVLRETPASLAQLERQSRLERRRIQAARGAAGDSMRPPQPGTPPRMDQLPASVRRERQLGGELQQLAVKRAVDSERQLYEVMVDFWVNHFNVFLRKGPVRVFVPDYVEHVIRPRALGKFEDLLVATAQAPAMLIYLDNWQSVAPGSTPPGLQARARPMRGGRRPLVADSVRQRIQARLPQGINENYARELMELHTMGVDGGYAQQDVQEVARVLTGWSVSPLQRGDPRFVFNAWAHDRGAKIALGVDYPAGHGQDEGLRLLHALAEHPSTRRHISAQLCARFVSDDPPSGCIDAGVHAWEATDGDIRAVVGAILHSAEFWAPEARAAKIKTPFEFIASAVRAVNGHADTTLRLAQVVGRLGQPLYLQSPPTGYPERQEDWMNSGALLERLNIAMGLAAGRLPGASSSLDDLVPLSGDTDSLIAAVNQTILAGSATPHTIETIRHQLADIRNPRQARAFAVGLALGSPEFQKQ